MNYQLLGRSGLRVSDLCLGTMTFGEDWGWGAAKDEARKIYDAYREAGGNFIDTANIYTSGSSEKLVGEFIAGHREEVVAGHQVHQRRRRLHAASPAPTPTRAATSARTWCRPSKPASSGSGTDYIDLYWLHIWDQMTPVEEVMRAFDDLVRAGKVLYVGISDAPGVGRGEVQHPGRTARLDALRRLADRVQPARTHGRTRTRAHGQGPADDGAGVVAAAQRLAHRQIPARKRRSNPRRTARGCTAR